MTSFRLNRRAMLRGLGGVAVALPWLEIMSPRTLQAQASAVPKRLVVFFTPNGTNNMAEFMPQGVGKNFTLGVETAPLNAVRDKLLILSGVHMESAKVDIPEGDLHSVGMSHMLTGIEWVVGGGFEKPGGIDVGFAGGPSIDQHIARQIGKETPFASLELGVISVSDYGVHPFSRMISAGYNQPVPPEDDPAAVYKRLFGDGTQGADAELEQALAQRRSVLDFVQDDFIRLQARLGSRDRQKLERHLTGVRTLEERLSSSMGSQGCQTNPAIVTGLDPEDKLAFPELGRQHMDLLALALQCDMTRVVSLQWSWARSLLPFPWIDVAEGHHNITHQDPTPELSSINTWYAEQLVYLTQKLDGIEEADGTSLLHNSVIWWCGETSRGYDHDFNNSRVFLLGSAGGQLKQGEHIAMNNEPHNKLLVHLMNLMGVPGDTFGGPFGTGHLTGINVGT
jgi:hypothetical protein